MDNANNYAVNSPYSKDSLTFFTVRKAMGDAKEQDCNMILQNTEQYAEQRRREIRSTKTEVVISGTGYYVSNSGDDNNDGKSPEKPWKTLDRVSNAALSCGDGVFFKRGDLFRGRLITQKGVTYSAYGEGDKPKIYGSRKNYAGCDFWKKTDTENIYVSSEAFDLDVGLIVFDSGREWCEKMSFGIKNYEWRGGEGFDGALKKDLQFHHNKEDKLIYLCSLKDPNTRGRECEIGFCEHCVSGDGNGVTIDNLCLKYIGAHGIGYGDTENLTVQNCELGWIGGSLQPCARIVRYGNAVEIYGACRNFTVENCYVYQCYDAGVTHQYFGNRPAFTGMYNVKYTKNLIEYCTYAIEWVNAQKEDNGIMKDIEFSHNLLLYSGEGWGVQRPYRHDSPFKGWQHTNRAESFIIYDNVATARDEKTHLVVLGCEKEEYVPALVGNLFVGVEGNFFGVYGRKENKPYVYTKEETPLLPGLAENIFSFIGKEELKMNTNDIICSNNPVDISKLSFPVTKEILADVDTANAQAVIDSVEKYSAKKRNAILETKTNVKITGKSYYVANDGDDVNDGLSPEKAWKTLAKVSETELKPGDGVFFKRGDLFRGQLKTQEGVTYSAYGEGEKPKIYGSEKNYAEDKSFWQKTEKENVYVSSETFDKDVGVMVFDGGKYYTFKQIEEFRGFDGELKEDLHMLHSKTDKHIYLYSVTDPNERFSETEISPGRSGICGNGSGVTIDNICLRYTGAHGIGYGNGTTGLTVQNCEIGWIGGMIQPSRAHENVRFGNGIEIYVGCRDFTVNNCWIYQCYDCGITHQYFQKRDDYVNMENIKYTDNLIEYCVYAIEYINAQEPEKGIMKDVLFRGNVMTHTGEGFGNTRPDHGEATVKGWHINNHAKNFIWYDNVIAATEKVYNSNLVMLCVGELKFMPAIVGNLFIGNYGSKFGFYGLSSNFPKERADYNEELAKREELSSNNFVFIK